MFALSYVIVNASTNRGANLKENQILNVEVPFYFKSIVDSMNVDFATLGGTAYTVAGSMIIACKSIVPSICPRCQF